MAKSKFHVGLEVGTSNTRVVVAEIKPDLSIKILGIGKYKSAGVRKGEIVDLNLARSCIKSTILEAEDASNVNIRSIFLALTGSHVRGLNNTGALELPSSESVVTEEHVIEVEDLASDTNIPNENAYVHTLLRQYKLDGEVHRSSPAGFMGKKLAADFHLIHGIRAKFQNSMRIVNESSIEIEDIVFSPIAAAQVVLNREQKEQGALVIDIGGGTTDYILYLQGSIFASGCIPIGGDHITNDIHLITHIPLSKSEEIKVGHGDVSASAESLTGLISIESEFGFDIPDVDRKTLNLVIASRLQELFNLLKKRLPEGILKQVGSGIFLTGGVSKTKGIKHLVEEIFDLKAHPPQLGELDDAAYAQDPQLSTVLGLIYYAQLLDQEDEQKGGPLNFFSKLFG